MEPYRTNMGGSFNRNMSTGCNQGRQMGNESRMPMNQSRQMGSCPMPRTLPVTNDNCDCKDNNSHMRHFSVGIGYVPMQEWGKTYDMDTAHCEGTIFPDLNLIFCGVRGKM